MCQKQQVSKLILGIKDDVNLELRRTKDTDFDTNFLKVVTSHLACPTDVVPFLIILLCVLQNIFIVGLQCNLFLKSLNKKM